jgi:hypothetical protein
MGETQHPLLEGHPHLRTVAVPRDANPAGDIFGGWTVSQMDIAGATFAVRRSGGRVATVAIEAMRFLRPIAVGDEVLLLRAGRGGRTLGLREDRDLGVLPGRGRDREGDRRRVRLRRRRRERQAEGSAQGPARSMTEARRR